MRIMFRPLGALVLGLASLGASATDFSPLLTVSRHTWPEKNHIGVVCNYAAGREQIEALREAAGSNTLITVVDTRSPSNASFALKELSSRKVDYLVLMPKDSLFSEGTFNSTLLVRRLATYGIPSIGTTPVSLRQGAVFALGEATGGELLVTDKLVGSISVVLPEKGSFVPAGGGGMAQLQIVGLDE